MAHHHRRQRIDQENRERLARAFNEPEQDYLSVADTLKQHYHHPCSFIYIWADTSDVWHAMHIGGTNQARFQAFLTRVCRKLA